MRLPHTARFAAFSSLFALLSLVAAEASAQTTDPRKLAAAQALYDDAYKAMARGDYATACPKLEEVTRLVPEGVGAKLTLAECYEGDGRLASAWMVYLIVNEAAVTMKQPERQRIAEKRAAALKPRLAHLTITLPAAVQATPGLSVRRDDILLGPPQWGLAVPVDKGQHEIVVTAPNMKPWKKTVEVAADGALVTVELPPLEREKPASAPPAARELPLPPPPPRAPFWTPQRVSGVIASGVGIVGLGVGTVFGARALSLKSQSDANGCRENDVCREPGFTQREDARSAGAISTVAFVAGGITLVGGVTLWLTAQRPPHAEVVAGLQGIVVRGAW